MICIANCKKLKYWVTIGNISNFAFGVGRTAKSTFSYFGHTLLPSIRSCLFSQLMGNDRDGFSTNNTLREMQLSLFRKCAALIYTYNN